VIQKDWRNTTIGTGSDEPNEQRATRRSYGRADQVKSKGNICPIQCDLQLPKSYGGVLSDKPKSIFL